MLPDVSVNYAAVAGAVVLNMVLGALWYGPFFGKAWRKAMGMSMENMTPEQKKKGQKAMGWMVLTSLVTAYVLAHFIDYTASITWTEGVQAGFWIWLGFQMTMVVEGMLFEGKKKELLWINGGYHLVALCSMGALLAVWA